MSSIKEQKEAFVTGHTGSNPLEVLLVCSSAPIGLYLFLELRALLQSISPSRELSLPLIIFLEAFLIVVPMALCQTILLYPYGTTILGWELILATLLSRIRTYLSTYRDLILEQTVILNDKKQIKFHKKLLFLTFYRSTISYLTFIAILAVDFPIFPRSFAKTEVQGYGLMDVGAASFCISGGMVSTFARGRRNHNGIHLVKKSMPLLVMGFIRLITTKGLDYQEHVSEYGVHWNFFFTLTVVSLMSWVIRGFFMVDKRVHSNIVISLMVPFAILVLYQHFLSNYGLQKYIEDAPRHCEMKIHNRICNLFAANREGILGCIGYLVLYLFGEDIGRYCLWDGTGNEEKHNSVYGFRIFKATISFWLMLFLSTVYLDIPVSRRSMSASFIFWVLAHNLSILLLTWLACSLSYSKKRRKYDYTIIPPIFQAVNNSGLLVFILANLMTGAVNLSMNTLKASNMEAIVAMLLYLFAVGAVSLVLDSNTVVSFMKRKKK
jgi:phosphatidylinositol glycan class W